MVVVCADFAKKITFATTQNHAAILHALSVRNDGPDDLNDLVLTCATEPPFLQPMRWPIDRIVAGGEASRPSSIAPTLSAIFAATGNACSR